MPRVVSLRRTSLPARICPIFHGRAPAPARLFPDMFLLVFLFRLFFETGVLKPKGVRRRRTFLPATIVPLCLTSRLLPLMVVVSFFRFRPRAQGIVKPGSVFRRGISSLPRTFGGLAAKSKMAEGFTHINQVSPTCGLSSTFPSIHLPAIIPSFPTNCLTSPPRHSHFVAAAGERKLGFSWLGLPDFGPYGIILWPITRRGGPNPICRVSKLEFKFTVTFASDFRVRFLYQTLLLFKEPSTPLTSAYWPRSVFRFPKSNSLIMRNRYYVSKSRGHFSRTMYILLCWLDEENLRILAKLSSPKERTHYEINRSRYLIPKLSIYLSKERVLSHFSSLWERSIPLSSLLGERTFPSLFLLIRGLVFSCSSVSKPEIRITPQSVLLSCVAVCTGPEDTTCFISMKLGGRGFLSTSQYMVTIWLVYGYVGITMHSSVDEFELKTVVFTDMLVFGALHISLDVLSSFVKLVSLSISFAYANLYHLMYAFGFCPVKLNFSVTRWL